MKALITGASSGLGRDIARALGDMGCELILTARREERLVELKERLSVPTQVIEADLASARECFSLYDRVKQEQIDILVNNAGFGVFGAFDQTDLTQELRLIDTNVRAVHILTKLFLKDFISRNSGYILNVSSATAFTPGPMMAAYYASKAYILHLTLAIWKELQKTGSLVSISTLCPGPVKTEFEEQAGVTFTPPHYASGQIAQIAVKQMLARKMLIVPGASMKLAKLSARLLPERAKLAVAYRLQHRRVPASGAISPPGQPGLQSGLVGLHSPVPPVS
ncbi:MAG TPA: SDR family oxidoreductase [Candidatus Fimivicinus intestinavium]|nr:SDR family oxidoreductase [Candidatus Fimivicinus intestinavium]